MGLVCNRSSFSAAPFFFNWDQPFDLVHHGASSASDTDVSSSPADEENQSKLYKIAIVVAKLTKPKNQDNNYGSSMPCQIDVRSGGTPVAEVLLRDQQKDQQCYIANWIRGKGLACLSLFAKDFACLELLVGSLPINELYFD